MDPEEFRAAGYRAIDWIADYLGGVDRYPVLARVRPGATRAALSADPPEDGEPFDAVLRDLDETVVPGITHWNHPAFFAYFANTGSGPGILGELFAAAFNTNSMLWKTAPAATELEELVLDWLRKMLGLPAEFRGLVQDTASTASLVAAAAAREAVPGFDVRIRGLQGTPGAPRLRLYLSEQAHSSIEKAAVVLGLGLEGVRKIPVDGEFRMRPDLLARAIAEDREAGWLPFFVTATVGTTSTTSVDPVVPIADVCEREKLWLHVDAAYAGSAAILPEMRGILAGCDRADSLVVNPHKWLFTPVDFSAFFCRDLDVVRRAFSVVPEYLRTREEDEVRNHMDYGVALGRRFRALKFWMVVRHFGIRGIADRLREHIRLARLFADRVDGEPGFVREAPVPFSVVCFRARPDDLAERVSEPAVAAYLDGLNERLMHAVNDTGRAYLSHTKLGGRFVLRLAIGNLRTTEAHVRRAWELLRDHAARIDSETRPDRL
jgi:aromatic-L-amino-acid decarboxylase